MRLYNTHSLFVYQDARSLPRQGKLFVDFVGHDKALVHTIPNPFSQSTSNGMSRIRYTFPISSRQAFENPLEHPLACPKMTVGAAPS